MNKRTAIKVSREWARWQLGERGRPRYDRPQLRAALNRTEGGRHARYRPGRWPYCRALMPVGSAYRPVV